MGWFDNLWRRRQGPATSDKKSMVDAHTPQAGDAERETADELEAQAHENRDEQIGHEPIPPGTG
ncbi:MAG: hypothetical protein ABI649_03210 [Gaiellaceae bacterium]